mmetsp:Transcript_11911/g.35779  ORF Transcript_11911/g.35779 Transcript_11911/m.35779 type:complete len:225 (-) Transcript_11911:1853-2527(-)
MRGRAPRRVLCFLAQVLLLPPPPPPRRHLGQRRPRRRHRRLPRRHGRLPPQTRLPRQAHQPRPRPRQLPRWRVGTALTVHEARFSSLVRSSSGRGRSFVRSRADPMPTNSSSIIIASLRSSSCFLNTSLLLLSSHFAPLVVVSSSRLHLIYLLHCASRRPFVYEPLLFFAPSSHPSPSSSALGSLAFVACCLLNLNDKLKKNFSKTGQKWELIKRTEKRHQEEK